MGILESIATVMVELWENRRRLFRLSVYDLKNQHGGTVLGFLWNFLNPAFQVLVYWFVFAIGLRQGGDVDGVSYVVWLTAGIVCWTYTNGAMVGSDMSIIGFADVLKRMRFPIAIVPAKVVVSNFITHIVSMAVVFLVIFITGTPIGTNVWLLPYYIFANTFFVLGYSLLASSITVLFRDFHNISNTVFRFLFFISPVMWMPPEDDQLLCTIMKFNPFAYILNGYRDALFYDWSLADNLETGLIFWAIAIAFFIAGCVLHMRLRNKFIDTL
ncbi:MAG: ABC transporter permease [Clostridia bacterium]|nr:ABC transporter permease [Clostridia bacterium]